MEHLELNDIPFHILVGCAESSFDCEHERDEVITYKTGDCLDNDPDIPF